MKRVMIPFLCFALMMFVSSTYVVADTYYDTESDSNGANNTMNTANIITSERVMVGKISSSTDVDYYKIKTYTGTTTIMVVLYS